VGSAQEEHGITGMAHMFEHMAFKGTPHIGTRDYDAEKKALAKVDQTYADLDAERMKATPDTEALAALQKAFEAAQLEAEQYIIKGEFDEIVEREGGVGLNAGTGADLTVYFYSLPSNKIELWAYLESERFMHPVFREFYKERDVVMEERRLRVENQPFGRLLEQFTATAFFAHHYHHPVIGYQSDLQSMTRQDAEKFYETYYVPSNMVTAVVGDVKTEEILPIIKKYFGRIPRGNPPPKLRTVEPPQPAEKTIRMPDPAQPIYMEGYHKGSGIDPEEPIFEAIADVLSNGRTSRLYRRLVRDEQSAVAVQAFPGYPGDKYPNLFIVFGVPAPGHTNEELREAIASELERIAREDITSGELSMVKTRAKAALIQSLDSNQGLANNLAEYHTLFGDWRELFHSVDRIDKVTKESIREVAKKTFVDTNRTIGMLETTEVETPAAADAGR
jgi:predicted Zn-dependent peptidase